MNRTAPFVYAVKAIRFLTPGKLRPADPLALSSPTTGICRRSGSGLYQLPPRWPLDLERFEIFSHPPAAGVSPHAVEFGPLVRRTGHLSEPYRVRSLHDLAGYGQRKTRVGPFFMFVFTG